MRYYIIIIVLVTIFSGCKTNDDMRFPVGAAIPNVSITKLSHKPSEDWLWKLPNIRIDERIVQLCINDYLVSTGRKAVCTSVLGARNSNIIYIILTDEELLDKVKAYKYDKKKGRISCKFNVPVA